MNKTAGVVLLLAVLLSGCGESTAKEVKQEAKQQPKQAVAQKPAPKKDTKKAQTPKVAPAEKKSSTSTKEQSKTPPASTPQVSRFYQVFKDSAKIATEGKEMLLLFGQDSDPYTQKLKDDVVSDEALANKISDAVTSIYIDARGQKRHKFQHNGEMMDVDTKTLVSIYNVTATPTLIFTDSEAVHIFVVPGYMPPKQFSVTLDFVKQKLWKGKDRKNGDVYEALKKFYEENSVEIKGAKK
jgi:thioredoxin-related protein